MQTFQLHHRDQNLLFAGDYRSLRECVEDALRHGADLRGVDLSRMDLSEINLDGAALDGASFAHANLSGANMSEASLRGCDFAEAALFNTCLCESDLSGSVFSGAAFGGTDIAGAILAGCVFSGLSALGLGFAGCADLHGATYRTPWKTCAMSRAPVVVMGLERPLVIFDADVLIGTAIYHCDGPVWRPTPPGRDHPLPHATFKTVALLRDLQKDNSPYNCIALQKSTEC